MKLTKLHLLLAQMTLQAQAGVSVDEVVQSALAQVRKVWDANHISLYQGQRVMVTVGEALGVGQLPSGWRVEKIRDTSGKTWFWPVMVRQEGWGWLVGRWSSSLGKDLDQQWELFTAHLGLMIQATAWGENCTKNHPLNTLTLPTNEDELHHFLGNTLDDDLPLGVQLRGRNHTFNSLALPITENEFYHFLFDSLPIGVALTDAEGNCLYVNEYLAQTLWQFSPQEMAGWNWAKGVHPADRQRVIQAWQDAIQTPPYDFTERYRLQRRDGSVVWIQDSGLAIRNPAGDVVGFLSVNADITSLKTMEIELRESQEQIATLLTNMPGMAYRYHPTNATHPHYFSYVSDYAEVLLELTPAQLLENADGFIHLAHPEDRELLVNSIQIAVANSAPWYCEWRVITPSGKLKYVQGRSEMRPGIQENFWDGIISDITAQKEAELRLQRFNQELEQRIEERTQSLLKKAQEEGLLRVMIETIHESLDITKTLPIVLEETRATLACDRVVVYQFNPDWTGYFLAESVGAGWVPVVTGDLTTLSDDCLQETQGGRFRQHYILVSNDIYKSGFTPCHIELLERFQARAQMIVPIFLEQKLWGLLAAYQNSSTRLWRTDEIEILQHIGLHLAIALRQSELYQAAQAQVVELQKLNRLKDEFLSTVSHELRSPMHNIGMAIKILELRLQRAGILDDSALGIERYLHALKTATRRETELINDLLDLARFNANAVDLILEMVDVQQILDKILPAIQERTQSQNQHFILQLPEHFRPLSSHAGSLERILQELLHNACKYTPEQETITLAIEFQAEHCHFQVINTGVIIPPEEQERVFDNFYRIPNHDPWQHGGTGLGLALVKKLVEQLQGEIHLISEHNRTEFRVILSSS